MGSPDLLGWEHCGKGLWTTFPSPINAETSSLCSLPSLPGPCYLWPGLLPAPYLEVLKSHLPERGLRVRHKDIAIVTISADVLAVEGVDAGPRDLGGIEVDYRAIAVDFKAIHGKPVPGRHWVKAVRQNESEGGQRVSGS